MAYAGEVLVPYLDLLASRIPAVCGPIRIVIGGSYALGDFQSTSDLDVLAFTHEPLPEEAKQQIAMELSHGQTPCPAHGLDLGIYRLDQLGVRTPEFELGFATGRDWIDEVEMGGVYPGGIVDLEIARRHGISLVGPEPGSYIPELPAAWLREELAAVIPWHRRHLLDEFHDPSGANAVFNAARAWLFFAEGRFASKSEGARWAAEHSRYPEILQEAALIRTEDRKTILSEVQVCAILDEAESALTRL